MSARKTLPPRTEYFYRQFVETANNNVPHPCDQLRFYRFIWAAHLGQTRLSNVEVREMLVRDGFEREGLADDYSRVYYHGRGLLEKKSRPYMPNVPWKTVSVKVKGESEARKIRATQAREQGGRLIVYDKEGIAGRFDLEEVESWSINGQPGGGPC